MKSELKQQGFQDEKTLGQKASEILKRTSQLTGLCGVAAKVLKAPEEGIFHQASRTTSLVLTV